MTNRKRDYGYMHIKTLRYGNLENWTIGAQVHYDSSVYYYDVKPSEAKEFQIWAANQFNDDDTKINKIDYNYNDQ